MAGSFARHLRLVRPAEYQRVFDCPCRMRTPNLTALARDNGLDYARLGLAISKKHVKKAVARNRLKRLVRETFRLHQDALRGLDIVVMARGGAVARSNPQLHEELNHLWSGLSDRCKNSSSC